MTIATWELPAVLVAAPIWAGFMTRATALANMGTWKDFTMPDGGASGTHRSDTLQRLRRPTAPPPGKSLCGALHGPVYCESRGTTF